MHGNIIVFACDIQYGQQNVFDICSCFCWLMCHFNIFGQFVFFGFLCHIAFLVFDVLLSYQSFIFSPPHHASCFAVKVLLDAYLMDFVFSESKDGGVFDNKNGMDYHVPVLGGVVKEPPMHIVHIAVEMAPIAKVDFLLINYLLPLSR